MTAKSLATPQTRRFSKVRCGLCAAAVFLSVPGSAMANLNGGGTPTPLAKETDNNRVKNARTTATFQAAAPAPPARSISNGLECASLGRRVAPSRVFSELQSSTERLVALDPMMRRLKRILVAKRSPSGPDRRSAITVGAGRGVT